MKKLIFLFGMLVFLTGCYAIPEAKNEYNSNYNYSDQDKITKVNVIWQHLNSQCSESTLDTVKYYSVCISENPIPCSVKSRNLMTGQILTHGTIICGSSSLQSIPIKAINNYKFTFACENDQVLDFDLMSNCR